MKSDGFNFALVRTMNTKCVQSPVLIKRGLSQEQADILMLNRARRIALRVRSERACLPCKVKKTKCSDTRPCIRCTKSNTILCTDAATNRSRLEMYASFHLRADASEDPENSFSAASYSNDDDGSRNKWQGILCPPSTPNVDSIPSMMMPWQPASITVQSGDEDRAMDLWAWEAASGPGDEDPFHNDWKSWDVQT